MIPVLPELYDSFQVKEFSNNTYRILQANPEEYVTSGYYDEAKALLQTIIIILSTERYAHPIYSWDFGIELRDLYGERPSFVIAELPRRITEALIQDNRITGCSDFLFSRDKGKILVRFTVNTIYGDMELEKEVTV